MNERWRTCTYSKAPGRVNEAGHIDVEATRDRVHNSKLSKSEDDVEHHDTDDEVVDDQTGRATGSKSITSTDEETSTNGAANGNHVQVAALHGLVQLVVAVEIGLLTPLEGLLGHAHTAPEVEAVVVVIVGVLDGAGADVIVGVAGGDVASAGGLLAHVGVLLVGHGVVGLGSHLARRLEGGEGEREWTGTPG